MNERIRDKSRIQAPERTNLKTSGDLQCCGWHANHGKLSCPHFTLVAANLRSVKFHFSPFPPFSIQLDSNKHMVKAKEFI